MANPKIKPCPCCESARVVQYNYDPYDGYQGNNMRSAVMCQDCGVRVERKTVPEVIDIWNRRPNK